MNAGSVNRSNSTSTETNPNASRGGSPHPEESLFAAGIPLPFKVSNDISKGERNSIDTILKMVSQENFCSDAIPIKVENGNITIKYRRESYKIAETFIPKDCISAANTINLHVEMDIYNKYITSVTLFKNDGSKCLVLECTKNLESTFIQVELLLCGHELKHNGLVYTGDLRNSRNGEESRMVKAQ